MKKVKALKLSTKAERAQGKQLAMSKKSGISKKTAKSKKAATSKKSAAAKKPAPVKTRAAAKRQAASAPKMKELEIRLERVDLDAGFVEETRKSHIVFVK